MLCTGCEWKLKPNGDGDGNAHVEVQRYDRLESRYLTTGDFSALQQMNIEYPVETRTLIEKVLQIGEVNDPENKGESFTEASAKLNPGLTLPASASTRRLVQKREAFMAKTKPSGVAAAHLAKVCGFWLE